jgi:phenylalanyl-tRNA synthetase alpha chain
MKEIETIKLEFLNKVKNIQNIENIKDVKAYFLGKNSRINEIFKSLISLKEEEKKAVGAGINELRNFIDNKLKELEDGFIKNKIEEELKKESLDITLPVREEAEAYIHPLSYVLNEFKEIALSMGFSITKDSEITSDWYCFESLNIPKHHPARQMQDTFFLANNDRNETMVLRTQTTSVDVKEMLKGNPPFKFISFGKTFRSEIDATHTPMFHQMDFVYVDKDVTVQDLKNFLATFLRKFFNLKELPIRFRPSYFPFTSPSIEVDVRCKKEEGKILIGEGDDWLEILGSGMLHPNVLRNAGLNPNVYQGFALGPGIERFAMLKYGIRDIRNLYDGDVRFLKAYGFKSIK